MTATATDTAHRMLLSVAEVAAELGLRPRHRLLAALFGSPALCARRRPPATHPTP